MADEPKGVRINTKIPNLCSLRFGFIASTIRLLYIIYLDSGSWWLVAGFEMDMDGLLSV